MPAIVSAAFTLVPDWTLIAQAAIFVIVVAVLSTLVFRPIRTIIARRREFTEEAKEDAAKLCENAKQLDAGREEVLAIALAEAQVEREKRLGESHRDAEKIISDARHSTGDIISSTTVSIETEKRSIVHEMDRRAKEIAMSIVERVSK